MNLTFRNQWGDKYLSQVSNKLWKEHFKTIWKVSCIFLTNFWFDDDLTKDSMKSFCD